MLESLRQLLARSGSPDSVPEEARERALREATAALFIEVGRADGHVSPEEQEAMRAALEGSLGLTRDEAEELLRQAEDHSRRAISLYELTQELDRRLTAEQKARIVELLWRVVFADSRKDPHEEHRVRQIAGLLHVPHPDFIEAKIRGRAHAEGGGSGSG